MLKNYLKVALRNLWRSKSFSFLNIAGLATGMAAAILISLWIYNEVSYDKFHKNADRLYWAWNRGQVNNTIETWPSTPKILGTTMKLEFPEVEQVTRMNHRWFVTHYKDNNIVAEARIADPAFLTMFSFPMVKGDPKTALNGVYSLVITESMATKMFGSDDPISKVIRIDSNNFTVTGVLKDLPNNTMFTFEMVLPWAYMKATNQDDEDWGNNSAMNFVLLKDGVDGNAFAEKVKDITKRHSRQREQQEIYLHPLSKWHLYSEFENGKIAGGRIETVRMFTIIAIFILIIACINFMNLSTARSEKRAREVGIRKVSGANKGLLVSQFLGESFLLALISGIIAIGIVVLVLPSFNLLIAKQLTIPFKSPAFWMVSFLFVLITGIVAGSYPAFFLSSFSPVKVLKGTFKQAQAAVNPRKVLVVVQFTFAIVLIISTIVIAQQINHVMNRETGYKRDHLGYVWLVGDLYDKYPYFKDELLRSGAATSVSKSSSPLTTSFSSTMALEWEGKDPSDRTDIIRFAQDEGLSQTAGFEIVKGRDINLKEFPTDSTAMIINETAAKVMGFKEAKNQIIRGGGEEYHVVGIFKDFLLESPYDPIAPMVICGIKSNFFNVVHIKLNPERDVVANVDAVGKIFEKFTPGYPFQFHFTDDDYNFKFTEIKRTGTLTALFAALTIIISCLGLFGLAAYMAENRIKEIGIRKVLGASVFKITALLSRDFVKLVAISLFIACPVTWFVMSAWLRDYNYRVNISFWVFAFAGGLSLVIAVLTVSYQSIRAALANPVKSLRNE